MAGKSIKAAKAAPKSSKTSAAAMRSMKGTGRFEPSGDMSRLISLGGGAYAYVLTPAGTTVHAEVGSAAFVAALTELRQHPTLTQRLAKEVAALEERYPGKGWAASWDAAVEDKDLVAAGS